MLLDTECLPWVGTINADGYGQRSIKNKTRTAHRLAWEASFGDIPPGLCVCHRCDNRRCVNPKHLFLGTPTENTADMVAKGRNVRGASARPPHSRPITEISTAKALLRSGSRVCDVVRATGIPQSIISRIKTGQIWKDVT